MKIFYLRNISPYLLFFSIVIITAGCKKTAATTSTDEIPTVSTTNVIINLTSTSAQSGGVIVSNGNGTITRNGVCYSATDKTPTITDTKTSDTVNVVGITYQSFTSKLTALTPNTTYYLRAYAINSAGTGYGGVLSFTTPASSTGVIGDVTTFAGTGIAGYMDGSPASALFNNPIGLSVDSKGDLYVSDSFNNLIREISVAGNVSTIAGNQTLGYLNGPALTAEFYAPGGQAFDSQGNLYVSDQGNNVIRKITPAGVVSLYAGIPGIAGYRNGATDSATRVNTTTDSIAMFNSPQGLAVDASGNVYVADRGNNVIREILTTGRTKTVAGNIIKGFIDGTGALSFFNSPTGVAVDTKGNIYVTDEGNSALRKIASGGVVTTLAGNPAQTSLLGYPSAIAIDAQGNLFIADESGRVLEFTTSNVLNILAGRANSPGFTNGFWTAVQFNYPQGIAVDASGNIYLADQYNNCIRKITLVAGAVI